MIKAQTGPDNHYMHVVARRARLERRRVRAASLDIAGTRSVADEEEERGSVAMAFLIGLPISVVLWVPLIWGLAHFF